MKKILNIFLTFCLLGSVGYILVDKYIVSSPEKVEKVEKFKPYCTSTSIQYTFIHFVFGSGGKKYSIAYEPSDRTFWAIDDYVSFTRNKIKCPHFEDAMIHTKDENLMRANGVFKDFIESIARSNEAVK